MANPETPEPSPAPSSLPAHADPKRSWVCLFVAISFVVGALEIIFLGQPDQKEYVDPMFFMCSIFLSASGMIKLDIKSLIGGSLKSLIDSSLGD
jgi:hypothetical protein